MAHLIELVREFQHATSLARKLEIAEHIICAVRPALWTFALRQGGKEWADDVCQEALVAITHGLPQFHGESDGQFWKWCYRVVRNKLIDRGRREKSRPVAPVDAETLWQIVEATIPDEPLSPGDRMDLEYALQLLKSVKPPCYDYLWLHYILDMDIAEIAEVFHQTYNAARMQITRCRELAQSLVS
jgi:RNA polymerase sigma factor (sigma-70 family)